MPTSTSQRGGTAAGNGGTQPRQHEHDHELTVTIPVDQIAGAITDSAARASRLLSAKGGLPVYVGLGVLAAADVIGWPVAAAAGLGYAAMRRWGPFFGPPARPPWDRGPEAGARQSAVAASGRAAAGRGTTSPRNEAPAGRAAQPGTPGRPGDTGAGPAGSG